MKAKILEDKKDKLIVQITDSDFETVNSIRRTCTVNVPTMAIEDVQVFSNNSSLYDEVLAHRLGLIPLTTDLKTYNKSSECKCKGVGCARCTVEFALEAKGPAVVMSGDLIGKDKMIKPVYTDIPIVKLFENQELKLTAKAKLNTGSYHTKHNPCNAYYQYYPVIKVLNTKKALDELCPRGVFKDGKVANLLRCNLCKACTDALPKDVEVTAKDDNILLTIESWGQLDAKNIYNTALKNLTNDLEELKKEV